MTASVRLHTLAAPLALILAALILAETARKAALSVPETLARATAESPYR